MRIFIFLFCVTTFSLTSGHLNSQNERIVIDSDKIISIDEVFKIVKKQTDYSFVYHEDLFVGFPKVTLKKGTIRLNKLLSQNVLGEKIKVIFTINNTILLKESANQIKVQQQYRITGKVTGQSGLPLPGITVLIKGTNKGVITNFDGNYIIRIPDPSNVLVFSSLGFKTQEIMVGKQDNINVVLKEKISQLDEVIINAGYYSTTEKERTGSISKIEAKDIEKQPVNNPIDAMQGLISGVHITQNSGVPGTNNDIKIRGNRFLDPAGTIAGTRNDPLYIVDGVPYNSGTLEDQSVSARVISSQVSPLNTLNSADIESIEVLKDADATAIYGARGANGVVLITTKKGKVGKTQVKLNISNSLSEVTGFVDLLNTEQYLEVRQEALTNIGGWPPTNEAFFPDLLLWDQNRYTDWQEVLIGNTAYRQNAQLSFSGGSEHTQFLLSGSYLNQTTIFPGDFKYKKATALINVNHKSENGKFNINTSVNYGADTNNLPGTDLTTRARTLAPNAPELYNEDGSLNWENFTWQNPLAVLETIYDASTYSLIANSSLSYRPIPHLEFKTSLGYTNNRTESYIARPHTLFSPNIPNYDSSRSSIITNDGTRRSWIVEPQINWQHDWDNANVKFLIGATFQQQEGQQIVISAQDFPNNELLFNLLSASILDIRLDRSSERKFQSFFARVNFNWQDKYILNLTGRRDGSSRFGPGKQFGYFGAVGGAWLFSEEKALNDQNILSFGKIRASYGIIGSEPNEDYLFYDSYEVSGTYNSSGLLAPTHLFNPNLAWGETKKLEAALELGFFKDRILLTTAWYRDRSSNQIIEAPLPKTTGFTGINANLNAVVQNTGIEVDLKTRNIVKGSFKWNTTFNISFNRNKLVSFPGLSSSIFRNRWVVGEPLGISRLYQFLGVDPETGIYKYRDFNNNGVIDRGSLADRQLLIDLSPKYFGGLGNNFTYKSLQLNVFFQFVKKKGYKYLNYVSLPGSIVENLPTTVLDHWQQPGDQNPIQGYFINNTEARDAWSIYGSSSGGITDTSLIRLRNVSLSYTVPKTFTKGFDLNIYLQGQNLFVITPYKKYGADPEVTSPQTLPPLRQFTLGLNLGF